MIQSLKRSMRILDYMARQGKKDYSIAELSSAMDLPPSSVYRVLQTFAANGYVLSDEKTHLYQLGPALIALGRAAGDTRDLRTVAMPFLQKIADETGDDAFLLTICGFHSQVIAKAEGPNRVKIVESFESNYDLHCGANRKILLAFQPDDFIQKYIDMGLKSYTSSTITEPDALWKELRIIREEQTAFSLSEFIDNAMGVSAPVFDNSGQIAASIGISGPAFQVTEAKINNYKRIISECAKKLSKVLGYSGK